MSWIADFPAASDFFLPVLTCHSFYVDPTNTQNGWGFCDPQVDQLASKAQAAQVTDPAYARRLWAQVDRIVTNQAPWAHEAGRRVALKDQAELRPAGSPRRP